MMRSSTAVTNAELCKNHIIADDRQLDRYCNEAIHFSVAAELYLTLQTIPGLNPISANQKQITATNLCDFYTGLNAASLNVGSLQSIENITSEQREIHIQQQLAIEQCKLAIMTAVYEDILGKCKIQQELDIAKKIAEQELKKQKDEADENVWWKKIIFHTGFWLYFFYSVTMEFFGYIAMISEVLGYAVAVFNPATLIGSIPITLIGAMLYIAFEGSFFGLKIAVEEKLRLEAIGEQINVNDKVNMFLNDEDYKKAISADAYRSFAFLAIQFNASIRDKKDNFCPVENIVQKRKYWVACVFGVIATLGASYGAGITIAATALAVFAVTITPVLFYCIVVAIAFSLLAGFYKMQMGALRDIFMPTINQEQDLRDNFDKARVKDKEGYLQKIQDKIANDRSPLITGDINTNTVTRIIEHSYADAESHQKTRARSKSMNFVPGMFNKTVNDQPTNVCVKNHPRFSCGVI